jgi:hypothetical protein
VLQAFFNDAMRHSNLEAFVAQADADGVAPAKADWFAPTSPPVR